MTAAEENLERIRTIDAAMSNPDLFIHIIEQLPDAIVVADTSGAIVMVNYQCELMFGYPRVELIGAKVEMLMPEAARQRHEFHRTGYMTDPHVRPMGANLPLLGRHKSGREFNAEINLSPVVTSAGTYAIAIVRRRKVNGDAHTGP